MNINPETIQFLNQHLEADPLELLLHANKYPMVDMKWIAQQLEGRRQAITKWPRLAQNQNVWYPPKLNREQSSSETTAQWKSQLIPSGNTLADLTGGMGIDSLYFAQQASQVHYLEMNRELYEVSKYNFDILNQKNIECYNTDSIQWIADCGQHFHTIYIDPARRDEHGRKVAAFEDCTPNLLDNLELLLSHCEQLIIKASPMIDIATAERQLKCVHEEIILAIKGECKEVLFICANQKIDDITIACYNLETSQPSLQFTHTKEQQAEVSYATTLKTYLYEPNAAIMKAGGYNTISATYHIDKLARNTHLYTSDEYIGEFPGRIFEIEQEVKLTPKNIATLIPNHKAHVISRNYPIAAPTLQQKLKLREGGDHYILATTLATKPIGILCHRK